MADAPPRRRRRALVLGAGAVVTAAVVVGAITLGSRPPAYCSDPLHAESVARVPLGVSPGFSILDDSPEDLAADLDALAELGVERLRVDVSWAVIEAVPGAFDWSATDRVLDAAAQRGIEVLAVIGYEPDWAVRTDEVGQRQPVDPGTFASFVGVAVQRYADRVDAWELWNEPNLQQFWGATPDPAAYTAMVEAASPEVRRADPTAPVLVGALAPSDDVGTGVSPATFVRGLYEDLDPALFDALSVHPYTYPAEPNETQDYNAFFRLDELHRIMTDAGDGTTLIWLTEYGAPTGTSGVAVSEQRQALLITTAIREALARDYVGPTYLYSLRDAGTDPLDPEQNFGLLHADRRPKPAFTAVADELIDLRCS